MALFAVSTLAKLDVVANPLFEGSEQPDQGLPWMVTITNSGPDARGSLQFSGGNGTLIVPVELPSGSVKQIPVYAGEIGYLNTSQLVTNRGTVQVPNFFPMYGGGTKSSVILAIGDQPGSLGFLRTVALRQRQAGLSDVYASPELAPTRSVAYENIGTVILSEGSQRMSDESVRALKRYVITGGTLVFLGGAATGSITDPRWADALPITDFRVVNAPLSDLSPRGRGPQTPVTLLRGSPKPGTRQTNANGVTLAYLANYGLGTVQVLAYDPTVRPMNEFAARRVRFLADVDRFESTRASQPRQFFLEQDLLLGWADPAVPRNPWTVGDPSALNGQSPFQIQLPPFSQVAWLLVAYFICVIPINFLVLRKLQRPEWAWVTAPLISLGFAGAFFMSARQLYSAGESAMGRALVVARQGSAEGVVQGYTELFLPRAGSYDLGIQDAESIRSGVDSMGLPMGTGMEVVDLGDRVIVPSLDVPNLSFRRIGYQQRIDAGRWLDIRQTRTGVTVTNNSPYTFGGVRVFAGNRVSDGDDLAPGATTEFNQWRPYTPNPDVNVPGAPNADGSPNAVLGEFTQRTQSIAVAANEVIGYRPGTPLGRELNSEVRLIYVADKGYVQP
jgi:hypothetical protein